MEWWKLFSGTFILIFLAELGDKTQLAAMAKTADSPGDSTAKWVVFLGASLALVASTFIAVFLGQFLKALVPDERYIKIAAGGLFLIFGFMILYETYRSFRGAEPTARETAAPEPGFIGELALRAAMDFETYAGGRYRRLAEVAPDELANLLMELAVEEDGHLERLRGIPRGQESTRVSCSWRPVPRTGGGEARGRPETLADLVKHEQATADFYQSLADRTIIPSLRGVFARLAEEERSHAARLSEMAMGLPDWNSGTA